MQENKEEKKHIIWQQTLLLSDLFCCLFNDAISISDYIASSDIVINELGSMWKEVVLA
jgi:hypothetical protein